MSLLHFRKTEIINGVPSFCAVAAKLGDSLADRSEQLHIIPSNYDIQEALKLPGNKDSYEDSFKIVGCEESSERTGAGGMDD